MDKTGALVPWLIRETSNSEESNTEIPLSASADGTHEEASNKIEDLKGLPLNVEKWIRMKDERKKLKLLQKAQRIYACRDKTEDKERVFNFGILTLLLLDSVVCYLLTLQNKLFINHKNLFLKNAHCQNFQ